MVAFVILQSCRLAPSIVKPTGTPEPSVSKLRLTPFLALSVGFGPVFSPAQRGLGQGSIHGLPGPVNPSQFVVIMQCHLPEFQKNAGFYPLLKSGMSRTAGTNTSFI